MRPLLRLSAVCLSFLGCLALAGRAVALDLDPRPERAPVRLPGELFGGTDTAGTLRVKLGVKKVKYSRVLETTPLAVAGDGGAQGTVRELSLRTPKGGDGLSFGHSNEVGLDVHDVDPDNPTVVALTLQTPDGRAFASDPLECVERLGDAYLAAAAMPGASVPVARTTWADKTPLYLIRRALDLPFDSTWRVAEDGPSTFLQRRFDRDLLDVGAVDLILRRPAPVQVNLVAALDAAHPRARTVLDWYALAKRRFELPDGRTVLRVYVGRYLRAHYPGLSAARLKEISLMFFRQGTAEVQRDRLVERVVFVPSGLDPARLAADGLPGRLPTRVREPFPGTKRIFVNVAPVAAALGGAPRAQVTAGLRLTPLAAGLPGGAAVEGAFLALVSPRRDTPAFLAAADELATSLGAMPDIDRPDGGITVTPLWSLVSPFADLPRAGGIAGAGEHAGSEPVFVSGAAGLFQAEGGVRLYRTAQGLSVEGRANQLAVRVDAAFRPAAENAYFFRLDIGRATGLSGVFLDVFPGGKAGELKTYALHPGAPTPLADLPSTVAGAKLRFVFSGREFALPLSRAMLVAVPGAKAREGLYEARLPWPVTTGALSAADGAVAGSTRFTPITPFGRFSWLITRYALVGDPVAVSVAGDEAVRPDTRAGILAGRLGNAASDGVSLTVSGVGGQAPGRLELSAGRLSGQALVGWRELFAASPLVSLGERRLGPGAVSEETAKELHEADGWLTLGPATLPAKAASARFFHHPWYDVSALCFETSEPVSLARFAKPPRTGGGAGHLGTLGRAVAALVLFTAIGGGAWWAGRKRLRAWAAGPADWLAKPPVVAAEARVQLWWGLGTCLACLAAGLIVSAASERVAMGLAGLALLPVWRIVAFALSARIAHRLPRVGAWFAADRARPYFLGFALALTFAAGLRLVTLVRPSEFLVQAGLYCFLAGLYLELVSPPAGQDAPSS